LFVYLEQRGADFLMAVKHSRRRGFQVIRDRLIYGRKAPLQACKHEHNRGRDLTWTLRGMPAPEWVAENWPGSAMVLAVRCQGSRDGKPVDETRYYVTSLRTSATRCYNTWTPQQRLSALCQLRGIQRQALEELLQRSGDPLALLETVRRCQAAPCGS
jgi:hypothetical protein